MNTASLSLDLDNQWSYLQTKGDASWSSYPSYLPFVVPRILELFGSRGHRITFFVVGKDATIEQNVQPIRAIAEGGHEIANHSFRHQPWLHLYSKEELNDELEKAEAAISGITGVRPFGFRGPGYSYSIGTLEVLRDRGYEYDCSSFPNSMNALARLYFFSRASLDEGQKEQRENLFGSSTEMFRRLKPYYWSLGDQGLLEIPVTTLPFFRFPIHFSYILYLSKYSRALAHFYFSMAMKLCALTGVQPSLLFHPLDFIGSDDGLDSLSFFPAMDIPSERKIALLHRCLDIMEKSFELVTMREHARRVAAGSLPYRLPPREA